MNRRLRVLLLLLLGSGTGLADPIQQSDISSESSWAAHLDAAGLQGSFLGAFLVETAGFDRVLEMRDALKEKLSLDLEAIDSVTLFGSGDQSQETSILLRGKFDERSVNSLPLVREAAGDGGISIHKGSQWLQGNLYLSYRSATELIGGSSPEAVQVALDVLDDPAKSWQGIPLADHAREELAGATAVLALDMNRIGKQLQFEADLTRSMQRAWLLIGSQDKEVEITVLIHSTDAEGLSFIESQLTFLTAILTTGEDMPLIVRELASSLKVQSQGHWMTAKLSSPPEKAAAFLESLDPLFNGKPDKPGPSK